MRIVMMMMVMCSCNNQVADYDFRKEHMQAERMNWEVYKKGSSQGGSNSVPVDGKSEMK